jgi:hypothetical protein
MSEEHAVAELVRDRGKRAIDKWSRATAHIVDVPREHGLPHAGGPHEDERLGEWCPSSKPPLQFGLAVGGSEDQAAEEHLMHREILSPRAAIVGMIGEATPTYGRLERCATQKNRALLRRNTLETGLP